ncbi:MAG TPA: 2-oxo acid dehydrogenase subunit E2, partial [Micromonosporaceae bacterium]
GAGLSLSYNVDSELSLVQALIFPPQAVMVSLAGREPRLRRDHEGQLLEVSVSTVGLSYDHRIINGREAGEFLAALRDLLQRPDQLG